MSKRSYKSAFLKHGFTCIRGEGGIEKPQCVLCFQVLSNESLKENKLKRHLHSCHPNLKEKSVDFFQRKESALKKQRLDNTSENESILSQKKAIAASYTVSYLIGKSKVAYSIGETLIKPAALAMVKAVCGDETSKKLTTIPLSNDTVQRRIVELSNNVKDQIVTKLKESKFFRLQLDECTDVARFSQLLAYVRFASNNDIEEHFLFCQPLSTTTTGEDIFNLVDKFFAENLIDWAKCLSVCTDGAPSMIGRRKGFVAHVKKVNPSVQVIHCMLHRENLASRELSETLHRVMKDVIEIVNFVKARALNSRLFQELCLSFGAAHRELLFHSETRWLSRGKVLSRVVELKGELETFLREKHFSLGQKFQNKEWLLLLSYLCDMMTALNTLNESMQGQCRTIIDFADKVRAFKEKLELWYVKAKKKRFAFLF